MSFLNCVKQKQPSDLPEAANTESGHLVKSGGGGYSNISSNSKKLITCEAEKSGKKMVLRADEELKKQSSLGETSNGGEGAASKVTTGKSGCHSVDLRRKTFCRQQTCPDVTRDESGYTWEIYGSGLSKEEVDAAVKKHLERKESNPPSVSISTAGHDVRNRKKSEYTTPTCKKQQDKDNTYTSTTSGSTSPNQKSAKPRSLSAARLSNVNNIVVSKLSVVRSTGGTPAKPTKSAELD